MIKLDAVDYIPLVIILLIILGIGGCIASNKADKIFCKEICESNDLDFYKFSMSTTYTNAVCYCKDYSGKITTQVM